MTEVPPGGSPVDALRPGSRVREWRIERFLARGAFGQVFAATRDSWQDEPSRALKVFDPILSGAARSALVGEFDLLRSIRHPHLLAGEDAFDIDEGPLAGCVVFVLERAEVDLATVLAREGPLPAGQVADVGAQLAEGLAALHEVGHLHGDVKPANALRADGLWKLGDFGVSAALDGSYARPIGATLDYRPPEVAAGEGRVHRSADIWALGTTLWVVASGQHPFVGADATVRHAAVLRGDRNPAPDVALALRDLIDRRLLVADPHRRATAAEAAEELRALARVVAAPGDGPEAAPAPPSPAPLGAAPVPGTTRPAPAGGASSPGWARPDAATVGDRTAVAPAPATTPAPPPDPPHDVVAAPAAGAEPAPAPVAPGRVAAAVAGGAVAGAVAAEVASLVATVTPGGLAARRIVHLVLTTALLGAAALLGRRVAAAPGVRIVAAAVAVAVAALVTAYLFLGP
ncbi:serine/threonine-protein kinase [Iamia majanohamensis]|uniref:non-specific serine/threonine protein kinase n=1 Tax=Iamia majanohamensis TaxID=467976 RepID=A0AAE9YDM8_9ACTN|nr:serine/threonine-protein kinase [Iamia majanohamensis]WCO66887.1 serine/threonine-protein kinase [Iamia majanohamensis]